MSPAAYPFVLFGILSACTPGPRLSPTKGAGAPSAAVLRASMSYDAVTAEIRLPCTVTNEGAAPLALLYTPAMETTHPDLHWSVVVLNEQGVRMEDCSARDSKARIRRASEYTVLAPGQQVAFAIRVRARTLVPPRDTGSNCLDEARAVPVGTYTVQVQYHDNFTRHRRAVRQFQTAAPVVLKME